VVFELDCVAAFVRAEPHRVWLALVGARERGPASLAGQLAGEFKCPGLGSLVVHAAEPFGHVLSAAAFSGAQAGLAVGEGTGIADIAVSFEADAVH